MQPHLIKGPSYSFLANYFATSTALFLAFLTMQNNENSKMFPYPTLLITTTEESLKLLP